MSKKVERSPHRRAAVEAAKRPPRQRKPVPGKQAVQDSDFGLALVLVPALRRRPDA